MSSDSSSPGRKARNIIIYFLILAAIIGGMFAFFKLAPEKAGFVYSLFQDIDGEIRMRDTPESTAFSEIGYDYDNYTLVVTFRNNDRTYFFYDVPKKVWDEFRNSKALGTYFNNNIKDFYDYDKVG